MPLLSIEDLSLHFTSYLGKIYALRGVNFSVEAGESIALVGESGCGKSLTAHSVIRLLPPNHHIPSGKILYREEDILGFSKQQLRELRGNQVGMIFQDAQTALNPTMRIGKQITEGLGMGRKEAQAYALELLETVQITDGAYWMKRYPHELSGGMRQRVMIAIALARQPELLIADEPTTALDVLTQKEILRLLRKLQKQRNMSLIFITHDLEAACMVADRIHVMYAGQVIEKASTLELFDPHHPKHPYTKALIDSSPSLAVREKRQLHPIEGSPPDLYREPKGCAFCPRCPLAMEICQKQEAPLLSLSSTHQCACWSHHPLAQRTDKNTSAKEEAIPCLL